MKALSSFTHPHVIPYSVWRSLFGRTQKKIFWKMSLSFYVHIYWTPLTYFLWCSAEERNSYKNDMRLRNRIYDIIFIFGWSTPLKSFTLKKSLKLHKSQLGRVIFYSCWWHCWWITCMAELQKNAQSHPWGHLLSFLHREGPHLH